MEHRERNRKIAQEIYDKIRKIINKKCAETQIPKDKIVGVVIYFFPENHRETQRVAETALGRVCLTCLASSVEGTIREMIARDNLLAS